MTKPLDNKELKKTVSIKLEPWVIDKLKSEFPAVSTGINIIVMDWISNNCKTSEAPISKREKELEKILSKIRNHLNF